MNHGLSSMKIGVDSVLLGCWASFKGKRILDVGTGCGIIALILAQRFPEAIIEGIDIDPPSIEEAEKNFRESPWSSRLKSTLISFEEKVRNEKELYDMIISNPPYFRSGIVSPNSQREKARHQASLSVFTLLSEGVKLLKQGGKISVIIPTEFRDEILEKSFEHNILLNRECFVKNNEKGKEKRILMEFIKGVSNHENKEKKKSFLTLFKDGNPTPEYRKLSEDFYLKF
ncbi:MAG: methyltransferase [Muribaculaceae bacterium]|nr:methyltransferase [Muribaculaceae bacterium]